MSTLIEKHRPKTFNDIIEQEDAVNTLKAFIKNGSVPNLIIHSSSTTGKTSLVSIFINEFILENKKERVLQLSSSDDRSIKVVRNTIKKFVSYSNDLKIVFLDDADSLTLDSQYALRRIMEDYSKTTRFILTCRHIHKLIHAIISRCSILQLKELSKESIKKVVSKITEQGGFEIENLESTIGNSSLSEILNELELGTSSFISTDINWNDFITCPISNIVENVEELFMDGNKAEEVIKSFLDFVLTEKKLENYYLFFNEVTTVLTNLANKGCHIINLVHLILTYRKFLVE